MAVGVETETVGQRLWRLRDERGLSLTELSGPGISPGFISRIENGDRFPSVKALRKLAPKLGVSAEYLETGEDVVAPWMPRRDAVKLLVWLRSLEDSLPETCAALAKVVTPEEVEAWRREVDVASAAC